MHDIKQNYYLKINTIYGITVEMEELVGYGMIFARFVAPAIHLKGRCIIMEIYMGHNLDTCTSCFYGMHYCVYLETL